ncbi:MAG: class I SAM-dependent methyltransferase [Oligoflexales bacterium]|nr:class I SAM-dependent methyltransferase [Oligoflexales bacterium]
MGAGIQLAESGLLPDSLIKFGINRLLQQRLNELPLKSDALIKKYKDSIIKELNDSPIAIETQAANEQHYEVPAEFFQIALGNHLKYSSCYYENGAKNLDQAEHDMLKLSAERAEIRDGMKILDLGCGWGSMSLWLAENFPNCSIRSLSNSKPQRLFIEEQAKSRGLNNIKVMTADINNFEIKEKFDRIVSIEMFEHLRNYKNLFSKIASWLEDDGKLFVHIFCHREAPYYFETEGDDNWMGAHFFTGGIMPSRDLYRHFSQDISVEKSWDVNGVNYQKTALAWLDHIDRNKQAVLHCFAKTYGSKNANKWLHRWRIFFLSCAELFGYNQGNEWLVEHYLFVKSTNILSQKN